MMPPESPIHPITTDLPSTLVKWRGYKTFPTFTVWEPLRAWFRSKGLHVFDVTGDTTVKPPTDELRAHDGIVYSTHYAPPNIVHEHRVCEHRRLRSVRADVARRDPSIVLLEPMMDAMY
jgi:hypothetical protein